MPPQPRPRRVGVLGARAQIANTVADVVNVSRTGALVRVGLQLRPGGEWQVVLELNGMAVKVVARVVRCDRSTVNLPGGAALHSQYAIALEFVTVSPEAHSMLAELCGAAIEDGVRAPGGS